MGPEAVCFGEGTAFSVSGYSNEELVQIRAATDPSVDALAARYEEEALPEGGEN